MPAGKLLALALVAVGGYTVYRFLNPGRILSVAEVEALAPDIAQLINDSAPPRNLPQGAKVFLPVASSKGFTLVAATVTDADGGGDGKGARGYSVAKDVMGRSYHLVTSDDASTGCIDATWPSGQDADIFAQLRASH